MTWSIKKLAKPRRNSKGKLCRYAVVKQSDGSEVGLTESEETAKKMLAALNINAK